MSDQHSDHMPPELTPSSLFVLKSIQQVSLSSGETITLTDPFAHMIVIVTKGTGFFHEESVPCAIITGSVLFSSLETGKKTVSATKEGLCFLRFDFEVLQQEAASPYSYVPNRSWKPEHHEFFLQPSSSCTELAQSIYANRQSSDPLERFQHQIRFQQLLHLIWSNPPTSMADKSSSAIDRTVTYIHTHFAEPISLVDLRRKLGSRLDTTQNYLRKV